MLVTKIGDSFCVTLPADEVARLGLKEGDEVVMKIERAEPNVSPDAAEMVRREEALQRLDRFRGMMPTDFKFDRDEANER